MSCYFYRRTRLLDSIRVWMMLLSKVQWTIMRHSEWSNNVFVSDNLLAENETDTTHSLGLDSYELLKILQMLIHLMGYPFTVLFQMTIHRKVQFQLIHKGMMTAQQITVICQMRNIMLMKVILT